jgi:hypothetical protein
MFYSGNHFFTQHTVGKIFKRPHPNSNADPFFDHKDICVTTLAGVWFQVSQVYNGSVSAYF